MPNERLRSALETSGYDERRLAEELGVDAKTVQRWLTKDRVPHRSTAHRAAKLIDRPASWLWPSLDGGREARSRAEMVAFYPHRSEVPRQLWLDVLTAATDQIWILAYASLFLPEATPEAVKVIQRKAETGVKVRIALGDPDSEEVARRGTEEQLFDAIPARVRMAMAYYRPLIGVPGVEFHLHRTTLYNSVFRFGDQMLINQHVFGTYGYLAPILHLRRVEGADLFDMYCRSFEQVWAQSSPSNQVERTSTTAG